MKEESFCSVNVSKLLKSIGFKEIVKYAYCSDFRHNGKSISFEEELDLKDEGRENEIEIIPFGNLIYLPNSNAENENFTVSAPTHYEADEWIRDNFNIYTTIIPQYFEKTNETIFWIKAYCLNDKTKKYEEIYCCFGKRSFDEAYDVLLEKICEYLCKILS